MRTYIQRLITRFLMCLSLLTVTVGHAPIVCLSVATLTVGCAPMLTLEEVAARNPAAHAATICARPAGVGPEVRIWAYNKASDRIVTDEDRFPLLWFAETADSIHEYSPYAPRSSAQDMPAHFGLVCPNRGSLLSDGLGFLPSTILCPPGEVFVEATNARITAALFAQPLPKKAVTGGCMSPGPLTAREQAVRAARGHAEGIGRQYGVVYGELNNTLTLLPTVGCGVSIQSFLNQQPGIVLQLMAGLEKQLNALPELPTYEDEELARAALQGFQRGFGNAIDEAHAASLTLLATFELIHAAASAGAGVAEAAGARAFETAFARLRRIPIFVPGAAGGVGYFLRLPKALPRPPVGNANPPSLPLGVAAPPLTAPLPFGNLSRAAEFGVKPFNQLIKAIRGTNLQGHHVLEQRFGPFIKNDPRMNLTVAVTDAEHQLFTNEWRRLVPYGAGGTHKITTEAMNAAARAVYKDYPAILKALGL